MTSVKPQIVSTLVLTYALRVLRPGVHSEL